MLKSRRAFPVAAFVLSAGVARASDSAADPLKGAATWAQAAAALAHHGPGTSGGGSATISGETLKAGVWDLDFREDYTHFQHIDREQAEAHASTAGEFDAVDETFVTTASAAYGITDDFQVAATLGWYHANNFISAERDEETGEVDSGETDPDGLTDLWVTFKGRVMKGKAGNLSLIGGVKVPTGRDDVRLDNSELLEPSSQPGSGSIDFQLGAGYSRFLTSQLTIDASILGTLRTSHDGFRVGDRLDLGTALAYRLTEDISQFPQWSVFAELNAVIVEKDHPAEGPNPNTGGTTLFATPGVRVRFTPVIAMTVAPSVPIYQNLNGDQDKTRWRLAATVSVSF